MTERKLVGREHTNHSNIAQIGNRRRATHRWALVWLIAASLVTVGVAEALAAPRHKAASVHRKKAAKVARHKNKGEQRAKADIKRTRHVIPRPVAGETPDQMSP